jgi:peroxiredoxin
MLTVLVLMMALALTLGAWLGLQLMGQQGRILLRLGAVEQNLATARSANDRDPDDRAGLPVGIAAPGFELPDMQGNAVTLQSFKGKRVLLIFFDPACGFCARMAGDVAALPVHGEGGSPVPVIITTGAAAKNQAWFTTRGIRCPVLLQPGHVVAAAYRASGTPVGYVIDARGRIASGLALGSDALLALAEPVAVS